MDQFVISQPAWRDGLIGDRSFDDIPEWELANRRSIDDVRGVERLTAFIKKQTGDVYVHFRDAVLVWSSLETDYHDFVILRRDVQQTSALLQVLTLIDDIMFAISLCEIDDE